MKQIANAEILRLEHKSTKIGPFSTGTTFYSEENDKELLRRFKNWWNELDNCGLYPQSPYKEIQRENLGLNMFEFRFGTTDEYIFTWFKESILEDLEKIGFVVKLLTVKIAWWAEETHQYMYKPEDVISEEIIENGVGTIH